jgi:hypothetical protein
LGHIPKGTIGAKRIHPLRLNPGFRKAPYLGFRDSEGNLEPWSGLTPEQGHVSLAQRIGHSLAS